jgi:hypothetical protein
LEAAVPKLSIVRFHEFMRNGFRDSIRAAYKSHKIFCEADLQSFAWFEIREFLRRNEETKGKFRILNKPFLRDCKTYPDLVVFRRRRPWIVIELKESRRMTVASAVAERKKLLKARKKLGHKRGYLVYVARDGEDRALHGPKGKAAYYFFEVPVILSQVMDRAARKVWRAEFKLWSKYVKRPK